MIGVMDAKQIRALFNNRNKAFIINMMEKYQNFPPVIGIRQNPRGGRPENLWSKKAIWEFKAWFDAQSQTRPELDNALAVHFITRGARIGSYPSLHLAFE